MFEEVHAKIGVVGKDAWHPLNQDAWHREFLEASDDCIFEDGSAVLGYHKGRDRTPNELRALRTHEAAEPICNPMI